MLEANGSWKKLLVLGHPIASAAAAAATTAAGTTAATAATAAAAAAGAPVLREVDADAPSVQLGAVQTGLRRARLRLVVELHEAEPPGTVRHRITNDPYVLDLPVGTERAAQCSAFVFWQLQWFNCVDGKAIRCDFEFV